jgi:hypothetical protein
VTRPDAVVVRGRAAIVVSGDRAHELVDAAGASGDCLRAAMQPLNPLPLGDMHPHHVKKATQGAMGVRLHELQPRLSPRFERFPHIRPWPLRPHEPKQPVVYAWADRCSASLHDTRPPGLHAVLQEPCASCHRTVAGRHHSRPIQRTGDVDAAPLPRSCLGCGAGSSPLVPAAQPVAPWSNVPAVAGRPARLASRRARACETDVTTGGAPSRRDRAPWATPPLWKRFLSPMNSPNDLGGRDAASDVSGLRKGVRSGPRSAGEAVPEVSPGPVWVGASPRW